MPADTKGRQPAADGYTINVVEESPVERLPTLEICPNCGRAKRTDVPIHGLHLSAGGWVDCWKNPVEVSNEK